MDEQEEKRNIEINAASMAASKLPDDSPYGLTQQYDRGLYKSQKASREYRDEVFKGKKTIRDSDGVVLHKNSKAAIKKYGTKHATQHQMDADHIDPIENAHQRWRKNPLGLLLRDSDFKKVINRKRNYQIKSAHANRSKQAKSDIEIALDPSKDMSLDKRAKHIAKGVQAQVETDILLTGMVAYNTGTEIMEGAKDALAASAIPLVIRGTQDLVKVAKGEMTKQEAIEDVGKLGLSIAANGGGTRVASFALSTALKRSNDKILKNFAKANQIGTILIAGSIIARAAGKYMAGEVDAAGFFDEVGRDGISLVSGMLASKAVETLLIGSAVGGAAILAPALAAMIVSAVCSEIYSQAKKLREEKKDNETIREIAEQASASIRQQQEELAQLLKQDHQQWVQNMTDIFGEIAEGLTNDSVQQTNQGLRKLMATFYSKISLYEDGESAIDALVAMRQGQKCLLN